MIDLSSETEILHYHGFCGLGGGAKGFNNGRAQFNGLTAKFRCIGGFDVSPAAIRDFNRMANARGTVLDLFSRDQYVAFHGHEPPTDWREVTPQDIHASAGHERPHIVFLSAPCKGFSGLLSQAKSLTSKYQALNQLTLRGVWMMCEAWGDDPPELVLFENVPRIESRGGELLDQIEALLRHYGYAVTRSTHDCGEIGGLAQHRKRFLLVARHIAKVPPFLYEPPKRRVRSVGEILEKFPLPGHPSIPMHAIPNLQWKTWVRLAFVEAGSDWRSLNKLNVADGKLADYILVPEYHSDYLGVRNWDEPSGTIGGRNTPSNGVYSVADPRFYGRENSQYGVIPWDKATGSIINVKSPGQGAFAVADPRMDSRRSGALGVRPWDASSGAVAGESLPPNGAFAVSDPRIDGVRHNNVFRIVKWKQPSQAVTGGGHPNSGGICVADPRPEWERRYNNLAVMDWEKPSNTVIAGGKGVQGGWMSVADPRFPNSQGEHGTKYKVQPWDEPSSTITGSDRIGSGALCIADPRLNSQNGRSDLYGVNKWDEPASAVIGHASHDNGVFCVADPRLPEANDKLVAIIRSLDGTWHRPFTTLELAGLQSLVDPDDIYDLDGNSDSAKRERIGNAVPPAAAQAIADLMGQTLLMAWSGETFALSATPIWVRNIAVALSVKTPEVAE